MYSLFKSVTSTLIDDIIIVKTIMLKEIPNFQIFVNFLDNIISLTILALIISVRINAIGIVIEHLKWEK